MSKERVAVMDADIFVYKVAQAAMKEIMFDEYVVSIGDKSEAIADLVPQRCLLFVLCTNRPGAVTGYVGFLNAGVVPVAGLASLSSPS